VDKEVLALRALRDRPELTAVQKAELRTLRDRLILGAVLDSALAPFLPLERAATVADTSLDSTEAAVRQRASVRLRDSTVARLGVSFAQGAVQELLQAFRALPELKVESSLSTGLRDMSTMPQVPDADTSLVLAAGAGDTVRVADLLRQWRNLSPFFRPRVETADQVKALIGNVLLEAQARRAAERTGLERRPDIRAQLDERREFFVVSQFVDREVWNKIPQDSVTVRRYFDKHAAEWIVPEFVRVMRMTATGAAEADSLANLLRDPVRAESLLAQSARARVNLRWTVTAEQDSALFAELKAAGVGAVVGPFPRDGLLTVVRVLETAPRRARGFDEARILVLKAWTDREGERRMRALLDGLRGRTTIWIRKEYR
jgi:hypothetical protein